MSNDKSNGIELRWYQRESVDSFYSFLRNYADANPVICLPTGAGKSIVIAEICRQAVSVWGGRVLVVAHRKELLSQNAQKIRSLLDCKVGEYSAGLRKFATEEEVVCCGIQSVYDKATLFDRRDLILIDEVHLVPSDGEGMYQQFLKDLKTINPHCRIGGLTATPFRTGEGAICRPDGIFHHVCYDAPVRRLMDEGFLSQVTNSPTQTKFDTSGLHMRYGEFIKSEVEQLFGGEETAAAVREVAQKTADRQSVMVFCSSIKHAETVVTILKVLTDDQVGFVDGNCTPLERAATLDAFANRRVKWLVNVDVLTTGFDAPCVDAIAILRATASPGLFAQIVGRGLRLFPGKENCLVLDFGQNIERHGPIDALDYGKNRVKRGGEKLPPDDPGKECPNCQFVVPSRKQVCDCGFRWAAERAPSHDDRPDTVNSLLAEDKYFEVIEARAAVHAKAGKTPSLRVDYRVACDREDEIDTLISEWICLGHEGFARHKAEQWWRTHSVQYLPSTIEEAVEIFDRGGIAIPKSILARKEGKFWRIISQEIEEIPQTMDEVQEEMPF
jgi:DNA repair protein RadD